MEILIQTIVKNNPHKTRPQDLPEYKTQPPTVKNLHPGTKSPREGRKREPRGRQNRHLETNTEPEIRPFCAFSYSVYEKYQKEATDIQQAEKQEIKEEVKSNPNENPVAIEKKVQQEFALNPEQKVKEF